MIDRTRTSIHIYASSKTFLAVYNLRYSHQGLNYLDKGDKELLHTNLKFGTPIADVSVELNLTILRIPKPQVSN